MMDRDRRLASSLTTLFLCTLCLQHLYEPVEAYDVLVALQNACGDGWYFYVNEGSGSLTVCAEILFINGTALTTANNTVIVTVDSSSALNGVDYFLTPTELTFPAGSGQGDTVCTDIEIIDDEAVENNEYFSVELSTTDSNVQLLPFYRRRGFRIYDNDVITITGLSINVSENNRSVQACVNITQGSVNSSDNSAYAYISTSASTGFISDSAIARKEFEVVNRVRLNFKHGDTVGVVRCITVGILDDNKVENDEHFIFTLSNGRRTQYSAREVQILILEDDVAEIGMVRSIFTITEADTSISLCAVIINFVELDIPLTAYVQTQAITATENFDYTGELGAPIDFLRGDFSGVSHCTNITIMNDVIVEYNEAFDVILKENSSRLEIERTRNTTRVTIMEDNDFVNIGFQSLEFLTEENISARARVCAQIDTGGLEREVTAFLSTITGGTATGNSDYVSVESQEVIFSSGQSSSSMSTQCGDLVVLDDTALEANETISIRLTNESPHVIITTGRAEAEVIIQEDANDSVVIGFPLGATLNTTEGVTTSVNVCPQLLEGTLERDVSVFATTSNISAKATTDYISIINGEIIFRAGESMQCIQIAIADDNNILEEIMETFSVTLTAIEPFITIGSQQESISINIFEDPRDEITVGLQQTSYSAFETGGPVSICAQIFLGALERNVSLMLTSIDGNATAPDDYMALNSVLVFTVGQSVGDVACTNLNIVDDAAVERDGEDVILSLSPVEPAVTVVTASSATVAIIENDNDVIGSIVLSSSNYDAFEANGTVSVCAVIMAEALERTIIVQLSSQDSTARNTEDYIAFQLESLTFDEGSVSGDEQCYDVVIIDDSFVEDNEIFFITLTSPEPALLGSIISRATVTINPDPADTVELGFQQTNYSVSEQLRLRDVRVCIVINNGTLERGIEITFNVIDVTADSGDYAGPFPMSLSFSRGLMVGAQQCTTVFALDDSLIEDDEIINISLAATSADASFVTFTPEASVATITIVQDPNDRAVIQLANSTTNNTFGEGETVNVCAELVNNGGGLRRPISLPILFLSGTATYGRDFNSPSPAMLTFPSGSTPGDLQCIAITLMHDNTAEATENLIVELRNNDSAVIIPTGGDIVIINIGDMPNPFVVEVSIVLRTYSGTEGLQAVEVCLHIVLGTIDRNTGAASVDAWTVSQTAVAGRDFVFLNTSLVFLPGDTVGSPARCVNISILNDEVVEATETFDVVVSSNSILQITGATSVPITINEDPTDSVTVGLQPLVSNPRERDTFLICAEITSGSLERNAVIGLEAQNNTAIQGVDFIGPDPSMLTFTSGQSTGDIQCANMTILDNSILEGERSFSVELREIRSETSVKINETMTSMDIDIENDPNDRVTVAFSKSTFTAYEGDGIVLVCAELLSGDLESEISLSVDVIDLESNTATNGSDYSGLPVVISFSAGHPLNRSICANITIIDDDTLENTETFSVALYTDFPEGVVLTRDRSIVEIVDNEEEVTVSFSQSTFTASESDGIVLVCAELLTGDLESEISLLVDASTNGSDYSGLPVVISFSAGHPLNTPFCANITIIDDYTLENTETFSIALYTDFPEEVILIRDRSTVEILDNEEDTIGFTIGFSQLLFTFTEGDGSVRLCAELMSGVIPVELGVVSVSVMANPVPKSSAIADQDYTGLPSIFSFVNGKSLSCIIIDIIDDNIAESKETLSLILQPLDSSPGVRISRGLSTVEIIDNDADTSKNTGGGSISPGLSASLAIIVIIAVALAVALVFTIVASLLRRRKKRSKDSARQIISNQESEETILVESPDKSEKSDIPLTMIDN